VRRGDLHARHRTQLPDGEREHRGGERRREHTHREAGAGEHLGRSRRERGGAVPRVPADHDRAVFDCLRFAPAGLQALYDARSQPRREPRGRPPDDGDVHPRRTRPDRPAQAGRAEPQHARHPVGEVVGGAGSTDHRRRQHPLQLGARPLVRVVGDPAQRRVPQLGAQ
jgi:hypothetical protein